MILNPNNGKKVHVSIVKNNDMDRDIMLVEKVAANAPERSSKYLVSVTLAYYCNNMHLLYLIITKMNLENSVQKLVI